MGFLRGFGWVACLVLTLVSQAGCVGYPPPPPSEGTSSGDGEMSSSESASLGTLDETGMQPGCGNGIVEVGESCDTLGLAGGACESLGFGAGTLACDDACGYETSGCKPAVPVLSLSFSQVKRFDFSWSAVQGAEHYRVHQRMAFGEADGQLGPDIVGESVSFEMPLHFRLGASYVLEAWHAMRQVARRRWRCPWWDRWQRRLGTSRRRTPEWTTILVVA